MRWGACLLLPLLLAAGSASGEIQRLQIPGATGAPALTVHWAPVDATRRPVVVALHGCGGLYRRDGRQLEARNTDYIERLHALGLHVLLPDSFGSRGLGSLCAQRYADRKIGVEDRRGDVLAALQWLQQRPEVEVERIALLGWSNGATTVLNLIDARRPVPALAAAVVFYPGCGRLAGTELGVPALLMQLGGADDWTPPQPCERLARRWQAQGRAVQLDVYAGAYHGFDGQAPLRWRSDVPNGVSGTGVHQGRDEAAAQRSAEQLTQFLQQRLLAPAASTSSARPASP